MNDGDNFEDSVNKSEVKRPPRHEDYISPNPYVRPWMEGYLPKNVYLRDFVVASIGTLAGGTFSILAMQLLGNQYGVPCGLILLALTLWFFIGEARGRHLAATAKFWMERNSAGSKQPK
jgi:hypothetical protein